MNKLELYIDKLKKLQELHKEECWVFCGLECELMGFLPHPNSLCDKGYDDGNGSQIKKCYCPCNCNINWKEGQAW